MPDKPFLTIGEVASLLQVSSRTVYNLIYSGTLRACRITYHITLITKEDFFLMIKEKTYCKRSVSVFAKQGKKKKGMMKENMQKTEETALTRQEGKKKAKGSPAKRRLIPAANYKQSVRDTFTDRESVAGDLYTMAEICQKFNYTYGRFYNLRMRYSIPCIKANATKCFPKAEVDRAMAEEAERLGNNLSEHWYSCFDIMRLFGSERIMNMMNSLGIDEDTPIDAKMLSNAIENAQKNVESRNFQMRKNVLEYDDVMNTQRQVIYEQRQKVLDGEDLSSTIEGMIHYVIDTEVEDAFAGADHCDDPEKLAQINAKFEGVYYPKGAFAPQPGLSRDEAKEQLYSLFRQTYAAREQEFGAERMRESERIILLRVGDEYWMDNIDAMEDLKQGIRLRAYGQTDPVVAYKREGFAMFDGMINAIREETVRRLYLFRLRTEEDIRRKQVAKITATGGAADKTVKQQPVKKIKIGANDPCPCGSGKKYKYCCRDKDEAKS